MEIEDKALWCILILTPVLIGTIMIYAHVTEPPCIDGHNIKAIPLTQFNRMAENPQNEIITYTPVSGWGKAVIVEYVTRC